MSHAATPELLVSGNGINVAPEGDFNDSKEQRWGGGEPFQGFTSFQKSQ